MTGSVPANDENKGVIPAQAGIQNKRLNARIPSFEGMTMDGIILDHFIFYVIPSSKFK